MATEKRIEKPAIEVAVEMASGIDIRSTARRGNGGREVQGNANVGTWATFAKNGHCQTMRKQKVMAC